MTQVTNESLMEARAKLADKATREEGIRILKEMREFAEAYQWRAGAMSPCCGNSLDSFCCKYGIGAELLEQAIKKIESGDLKGADPLLDKLQEQFEFELGEPSEITAMHESGNKCQR